MHNKNQFCLIIQCHIHSVFEPGMTVWPPKLTCPENIFPEFFYSGMHDNLYGVYHYWGYIIRSWKCLKVQNWPLRCGGLTPPQHPQLVFSTAGMASLENWCSQIISGYGTVIGNWFKNSKYLSLIKTVLSRQ